MHISVLRPADNASKECQGGERWETSGLIPRLLTFTSRVRRSGGGRSSLKWHAGRVLDAASLSLWLGLNWRGTTNARPVPGPAFSIHHRSRSQLIIQNNVCSCSTVWNALTRIYRESRYIGTMGLYVIL